MDVSDVRVVFGPDELTHVGEFRYRIYIEEQGKHAEFADRAARTLIEPADRRAATMIFWIEREGAILGSLRAEVLSAQHEDAHRLGLQRFDFLDPTQIIYFSRLMIAKEARGSDVTPKLCWLGFAMGLLKGCSLGLLTCKPELVSAFEKYGYLEYAKPFIHPESGAQVPMAILGEVEYLKTRGAPLVDWLARHRPQSPHTLRFLSHIAEHRLGLNVPAAREARGLIA
jgi:hypothetical protein